MSEGLIQGLAAIRKMKEEEAARAAERERPKANWFSSVFPKKTGDTVEGRFLQELDEEMANYLAERGVGFVAVEHNAPGPEGYKRRAKCTMATEGECYACERHSADYQAGWKAKKNLYIYFLMEWEGKPTVFVISRNANSGFADQLFQEAIDEGSITDANYRITKTGTGTKTNWLLKRLKGAPLDDSSVTELPDLKEVALRDIEYAKQPDYYGAVMNEGSKSDEGDKPSAAATSSDEEW